MDTAWGQILHGWSIGKSGEAEHGISQIHEALDTLRDKFKPFRSFHLALLAELYLDIREYELCRGALEQAQQHIDEFDERFWQPEIHRRLGELRLQTGGNAEACFIDAINSSRAMGAKQLELRARRSLDNACGRSS